MVKKSTSLWLDPIVHKRLRLLSAEHGMPLGDVIQALTTFQERLAKSFPEGVTPARVGAFWRACIHNTGKAPHWWGEEVGRESTPSDTEMPDELSIREQLARITDPVHIIELRESALDSGDWDTAQAAQDRLDALENPEGQQE